MELNKTELRYYLKEKYNYSELKIQNILDNGKLKIKGPLAYALGYVDFLDTKIDLRYKTLVPRPETEYWVKNVIDSKKKVDKERAILDIFCGSGCIGISILKHLNNTHVTFSDIDMNAIKQTKYNLKNNNISKDRYTVIQSDLFKDIPKQKFDIIFANPPYVGKNDEYGKEVLLEPENAVFAEDNGLAVIKQFLSNVLEYLKPKGILYMEMGENQMEDIKNFIKNPNARIAFKKDQYEKVRVLEIKKATY